MIKPGILPVQQGYKVVGLDVNDPEDERKDDVLQQHHGLYQMLKADLSQEGDVKNAISVATKFFGKQVCQLAHCSLSIRLHWVCGSKRITQKPPTCRSTAS